MPNALVQRVGASKKVVSPRLTDRSAIPSTPPQNSRTIFPPDPFAVPFGRPCKDSLPSLLPNPFARVHPFAQIAGRFQAKELIPTEGLQERVLELGFTYPFVRLILELLEQQELHTKANLLSRPASLRIESLPNFFDALPVLCIGQLNQGLPLTEYSFESLKNKIVN